MNALLVAAVMCLGLNAFAEDIKTQNAPKQIDINTAPVSELEELPGIGPAKAEAIVAHRTRRPFKKPEDIMRVKGIGRKTFKKLKAYLTVSPVKKRSN